MGSDKSILSCVPAMLSFTDVFFPAHYYSMSKIWMMFISSHFTLLRTLLKSTYTNIGTVFVYVVYINKCHGNILLLVMYDHIHRLYMVAEGP